MVAGHTVVRYDSSAVQRMARGRRKGIWSRGKVSTRWWLGEGKLVKLSIARHNLIVNYCVTLKFARRGLSQKHLHFRGSPLTCKI